MIRTVLIDTKRFVLDAFGSRIALEPDFNLVGTAVDCDQGLAVVLEREPELTVLDVDLPGRGSFDLTSEIRRQVPGTRIAFLTAYLSDVFLDAALRLGASGYLLQEEPSEAVFEHLRRIASGESRFSPRVQARLKDSPPCGRLQSRSAACLASLTHLQFEVLRHLARGDSVKQVAHKVRQSPRSVESQKYRIMQQLGIHDRVELSRFAIREGLAIP